MVEQNKPRRKRNRRGSVDFILLVTIIILVLFGLLMVYSSSWPTGVYEYDDGAALFKGQVVAAILGFIVMFLVMNINYKIYKKVALPIFIVSLILGLLIFTPLGDEQYGATRWVVIGPFNFMPSDIIKLGSVIFFSNLLYKNREYNRDFFKGTIKVGLLMLIPIAIIYLSKDLSTPVVLAGTLLIMYIIAGMNLSHLIVIMIVGSFAIYKFALDPAKYGYRWDRIRSIYDPDADPLGERWHLNHSLYALGIGGLFGSGLGMSTQKFTYLTFAYNDFIFAVVGEEFGFLGTVSVILLFILLVYRGAVIAMNCRDLVGKYMAVGITAMIGLQVLVNIGVVTGVVPTTGTTLPFLSQGGTSLIINMAAVGILLNISRYNPRRGS